MSENKNKNELATDKENETARKYWSLVEEMNSNNVPNFLIIEGVSKKIIKTWIIVIQDYYKRLFNIQYEISQIERNKYVEDLNSNKIFVYAVDAQALNWLNRLSHILNNLTLKMSEFDVKESRLRDIIIFASSIILSTIIGCIITFIFNVGNSRDLETKTNSIKQHQDLIINKVNKEIDSKLNILKLCKCLKSDTNIHKQQINKKIETIANE